ncbi:MAG TPA: histidine phosphatase family protein [Candidatus Paceibacterota bacterium]|nr:histidine phosphatase family protein [Candidatus Paceibacterota bacterium]
MNENLPSLLVHVRHTQPDERPGVADRDLPLSAHGKHHIREIAWEMYRQFGAFDCVFYSQFRRSHDVAREIVAPYTEPQRNMTCFIEAPLLNERNRGGAFGLTEEEIAERFPEFAQSLRKPFGEIRERYPNGENLWRVLFRVSHFAEKELPMWTGKKICISGHWGTALALRYALQNHSYADLMRIMGTEHPPHGSLLVFEPENGRMVLREKNLLYEKQSA